MAEGEVVPTPGALLGRAELGAGAFGELWRTAKGMRMIFDDSGTFDVIGRGREIVWYPRAGCDAELARVDMLGRVLSLSLYEQGMMPLHGSAVSLPAGAVGFLAAKGSGKSTLAMTLVSRGARLMTDDTLAVSPSTFAARPGVHSVRLWEDSAGRFASLGGSRLGLSDKRAFDALPTDALQDATCPVAALYELVPVPDDGGARAKRERMTAPLATIALMRHSKLGVLLGGVDGIEVFSRCAAIAERVPMYTLFVSRDLAAVDDVADTIAGWHE
ncbi:MAG: hypothetical protein ABMA00_14615 [Gemmatimonas sp.]